MAFASKFDSAERHRKQGTWDETFGGKEFLMFCVRVAVKVKPEGAESFLAQLDREAREIPDRFDGCEHFAVYRDPANENSMLLYEEWTNREAADVYLKSDYFQEARQILIPLVDGAPDSAYYEAERVGP